jgi:hypothetical protein
MYATNNISTTNYASPAYYSGAYSSNGSAPNGQSGAKSVQAAPIRQSGDFRAAGPGPWAPSFIERPANQPPGAPDTPVTLRSEKNLLDYSVDPSNLRGLQPDRNGIYARVNPNQSKNYFAKVDGDTYRVGGFDRSDTSWRVLDPRSGKEVSKLQRENGKWVPKDLMPPATSYPRGAKGQMLRAVDSGIENIRLAKTQLNRNWDPRTSSAMRSLFGGGAFTPAGKVRIEAGFDKTLGAMRRTKDQGGRNLSTCPGGLWPGGPSARAWPSTGEICFAPYALRSWSNADLNELAVHEHTHTGAYTNDNWYLQSNLGRYPNWSGYTAPFTFDNAVNNADTMARATSVLANNEPA